MEFGNAKGLTPGGAARFRSTRSGAAAFFCFAMVVVESAWGQPVFRHLPEAVAASEAVGSVSASQRMSLSVGLPVRNAAELDSLIHDLFDPSSPNFRHYLTPEQFTERFGPSEADYRAVADYLASNGLTVTATHPNRMILDVSGAAADIERTFQIRLMRWRHPQRGEYFAPDREPSFAAGLAIQDVAGLDNFVIPHPMSLRTAGLAKATPLTAGSGSGPSGLLIGADFRTAYAPKVTLTGSGQSVGLFELDGFYPSDVAANFSISGIQPVPVQTILLDGYGGYAGFGNTEVTLDIMMAAYMAPGLSSILVYEGTSWNDVLNRMATDNLAAQLSSSWCYSPTNATTEQIFKEMITQGQSMFQASGDGGAYTGWIMPPADDPNVTVVGGTSLTTAYADGPWQAETAWWGSGGGVSTSWSIPSYQQNANVKAAGGSTTMRNIPDVALTADIQMYLIQSGGQAISVGGTSAAAPLWAGFMALANQQAANNNKPRVGFLNPLIYQIGEGANLDADLHDIVTGDNNGYAALPAYDLATGWGSPAGQGLINDLTSVSNAAGFALSLSSAGVTMAAGGSGITTLTITPENNFSGTVNLAVTGLPVGVTASWNPASATRSSVLTLTAAASAVVGTSTLTLTGTSGGISSTARLTVTVTGPPSFTMSAPATVSVADGGSTAVTLAVGAQNGFSGTVSMAVAGLPAGVTGTFSPVTAVAGTVLTLQAGNKAAVGTSTLTVTGTSGSLHATVQVKLTVTVPGFSLSASPASLSVGQGGNGTSAITVAPQTGFAGSVTLSATGLPAGVTAAFSPAAATKSSTLTFTASAGATAGVATVTVTGVSGAVTSKTTIALTVTAPSSFSLAAAPASLSINVGSNGSAAITVVPQNGFNAAVTFSASGLPAGVTAAFSPAAAAGGTTVKLTAEATATPGNATVTITGVSGKLTAKTTVALAIPVPGFLLAAAPATLSISPGTRVAGAILVEPQNGFSSAVTFTASGLPTGVTAAFSPAASAAGSTVTFTAAATAAAATAKVTFTGKSGSLTQTATLSLTVVAAATSAKANLASVYNVAGIVADSGKFTTGGLDGGGRPIRPACSPAP